VRAGKLRHLVIVEQFTETQNSFGEPVKTWTEFATLWASREEVSGQEAFKTPLVTADVVVRFTTRYREGITPQMRLNWYDEQNDKDRLFSIESALDPDGTGRTLVITARKNDA
jgi:SPP1 family predicted phage head-tail adaptor